MIVRLQFGGCFQVPELRQWLLEAMEKVKFPGGERLIDFLAVECQNPGTQVLIGFEEDKMVACSVLILPGSPLMLQPQVAVAYNEGSPKMGREMMEEMVKFVKEAGYSSLMFCNHQGHSDKAAMRRWRPFGEAKRFGTTLEVALK